VRHIIIGEYTAASTSFRPCSISWRRRRTTASPPSATSSIAGRTARSARVLPRHASAVSLMATTSASTFARPVAQRGRPSPDHRATATRERYQTGWRSWRRFRGTSRYRKRSSYTLLRTGRTLEAQRDTVVIGTMTGERYMQQRFPTPWYEHYAGPSIDRWAPELPREQRAADPRGLAVRDRYRLRARWALTALVLPEFRIASVPARKTTVRRTPLSATAASVRSILDLDWPRCGSAPWQRTTRRT